MALLTCDLCRDRLPSVGAVRDGSGRTFCCHACRELFGLLPEDALSALNQSRPPEAPGWNAIRPLLTGAARDLRAVTDPLTVRTVELDVDGLWCASCTILLEHVLRRTGGVLDAHVDYALRRCSLVLRSQSLVDPPSPGSGPVPDPILARAQARARKAGYLLRAPGQGITDGAAGGASPPPAAASPVAALAARLLGSTVLAIFVMMGSVPVWSHSLPHTWTARIVWGGLLAVPACMVVLWGGQPFLYGAVRSIRDRVPTMDLLVALGSLTALVLSLVSLPDSYGTFYFDTACMLTVFLLLGRTLEAAALDRAGAWVRSLVRLFGDGAFRLDGNAPAWVARDTLRAGDRVWVAPGHRVPADGVVALGSGSIDTSVLTGESWPRDVGPGDRIVGGSLCLTQGLTISLGRSPKESLLWQTVRSVEAFSQSGGRLGRFTDGVIRAFVPGVLVVAMLTFGYCLVVGHLPLDRAALRAAAVLVVACPCALSVATPLAALTGTSRLLEAGVLVRRRDALERAGRIDTLLLDKTGTLTDGQFVLTDLEATEAPDPRILAWVARVENGLDHPVARALAQLLDPHATAAGETRTALGHERTPDEAVTDLEVRPGFGVRARIGDHALEVGTFVADPDLASAVTRIGVWLDGILRYRIGLRDSLRPHAPAVIASLRRAGYDLWLLSGDGPARVVDVAAATGIPEGQALGTLTPQDKVDWVQRLTARGRYVAVLGDGLNDAAALAVADLGIAMGTGTEIAAEASGFVLARGELEALPDLLAISGRTTRVMQRNLWWALGYNALALPAAMVGLASPALAALCMMLSSVFVLGSSLSLSGFAAQRFAKGALGAAFGISVALAVAWWGL